MFQSDKASMLDEAIEYMKSLQLQIQVLASRNRLVSIVVVKIGLVALTDPKKPLAVQKSSLGNSSVVVGDFSIFQYF